MSTPSPGVIDDYLEGLLHDMATAEQDTSRPVAAGTPGALDADQFAAAVPAEADADPALAGALSTQVPAAERKGPTPEALAAAVLAEADADPALAGALSTTSRNLAEADDAAAMQAARRRPTAIPPERRAEAERSRDAFASQVPVNLQSFMPPGASSDAGAPPHNRRAPERSTRWLRLRCGEQAYALELLKVQEVMLPVPLLALRGTPPSMLGIMNLRGQVVPVIDLGLRLGAAPIEMDILTRIVVLEESGETLGLRVSAVEDVTSLTEHQIELPDTARICRISNDLFRGVARVAGPPMILLDAGQLLH